MKKSRMFIHPCPEHQADATLSQANPVSGTKYTVLDTTENVRIIWIRAKCTWTVQPTPLEVHITIDGESYSFYVSNPASAIWHNALFDIGEEILSATIIPGYRAFFLEGRSIKVEVEITGGTVSNLSGQVRYAKW